jgi:hypothetical protein
MDIIIAAIAGALGNLGSDAVKTGFNKLKDLVLRKSGAAGQAALENWEKKPESAAWKGALHEELEASGVDKDAEIIKAAQALLDAVKAQPGGEEAVRIIVHQQVTGDHSKAIAVTGGQNVNITA